jgi:5-methylcytosine-specific restriction endonuclease McrA
MQREYSELRRAEARALLRQIKAKPCLDCGGSFPSSAMHFDHRDPFAKNHNVSKFATTGSIEGMLAEIEQCDLVCANCHAARTDTQRRLGLLRGNTLGDRASTGERHQRRLDAASARKALSIAMQSRRVDPPSGYESLADAAKRYGVSGRTLRRRIEDGELEAERLKRPQGSILFVKIPPGAATLEAVDAAPSGAVISDQENDDAATLAAVTALDEAFRRAEERAAALDERNERQAGMMVEQAERIGRLTAKLDAATAGAAERRRQLDEARRPWWRFW